MPLSGHTTLRTGALLALLTLGGLAGCDDETKAPPCAPTGGSGSGGGSSTGGTAPPVPPQGRTSLFVEIFDNTSQTGLNEANAKVDSREIKSDALGRILFGNLAPGPKIISFFGPNHTPMRMSTNLPDIFELRAAMRVTLKPRVFVKDCKDIETNDCPMDEDGFKLTIPAGSLRTPQSTNATGNAKLYVTGFQNVDDRPLLPGSVQFDEAMTHTVTPLRVWTMAAIEVLQDKPDSGDANKIVSVPLDLKDGTTADLKMEIVNAPASLSPNLLSARQTEVEAAWIATEQPGSVELVQGQRYWSTQMTRLGLQAAVEPVTPMEVTVTVSLPDEKDAQGKPLPGAALSGAYVQVTSSKYRSHSTGFTGNNGEVKLRVPVDLEDEPSFAIQLPGYSIDKPVWQKFDSGKRSVQVKLGALPVGAEVCTIAGETRDCSDPGAGTGTCAKKVRYCDGVSWGACAAVQQQLAELCNGIDDACNGDADEENAEVGNLCGTDKFGACSVGTVTACTNGVVVCTANTEPQTEECNGIDDDCDGVVDNGIAGVSEACMAGSGTCMKGTNQCINGAIQCVSDSAKPEVCNGEDDDCDGQLDEDLGTLTCGVGACQNTVPLCENGMVEVCQPSPAAPQENCDDNIDNDCDGIINNNCCVPVAESCNGKDDDCDGMIDDDCCDPAIGSCPASPEICDDYDNDLDGKTDALDDVLYEADGVTIKSYRCCPDGKVDNQANADGIDNDCDSKFDWYDGCSANLEATGNGDDNCNGFIDEPPAMGSTCIPGATEICDGFDQDCDGIADDGLCCTSTLGLGTACVFSSLWDKLPVASPFSVVPVAVHDSTVAFGANGAIQIYTSGPGGGYYVGTRYLTPMKKEAGQKNRWYWEVAIAPGSSGNAYWCIGIGTATSAMATSDPDPNGYRCLLDADVATSWDGAVLSVLLDLVAGEVRYWFNGSPMPALTQPLTPQEATETYYPMTWQYHLSPNFNGITHNFGAAFIYPVSDLYDAPVPIIP